MSLLRKTYNFLIDAIQTLVLGAALFLVVYVFLFRPFQVSGQSMFPNFKDKEYILTNLIVLRFQNLHLGDVVVFKAPVDQEKDYIKRVIGVAGDRVSIQNGEVYLNGAKLDESAYLKPDVQTYGGSFLREGQEVTVPQNSYFVLGDNRAYSSDSREWGFVSKRIIIGKSFFAYWPVQNIGVVKNPYKK